MCRKQCRKVTWHAEKSLGVQKSNSVGTCAEKFPFLHAIACKNEKILVFEKCEK